MIRQDYRPRYLVYNNETLHIRELCRSLADPLEQQRLIFNSHEFIDPERRDVGLSGYTHSILDKIDFGPIEEPTDHCHKLIHMLQITETELFSQYPGYSLRNWYGDGQAQEIIKNILFILDKLDIAPNEFQTIIKRYQSHEAQNLFQLTL